MAIPIKPKVTGKIQLPGSRLIDNKSGSAMSGMTATNSGVRLLVRFDTQSSETSLAIIGGTLGVALAGTATLTPCGSSNKFQVTLPDAWNPQSVAQEIYGTIDSGTWNGATMLPYDFTLIGDPTYQTSASGYLQTDMVSINGTLDAAAALSLITNDTNGFIKVSPQLNGVTLLTYSSSNGLELVQQLSSYNANNSELIVNLPITLPGLGTASGMTAQYKHGSSSGWTTISLVANTAGTYLSGGWAANAPYGYELGAPAGAIPKLGDQGGFGDSVVLRVYGGTSSGYTMQPISVLILPPTNIVSDYDYNNGPWNNGGDPLATGNNVTDAVANILAAAPGSTATNSAYIQNGTNPGQILLSNGSTYLAASQHVIVDSGTVTASNFTTPPTANAIAAAAWDYLVANASVPNSLGALIIADLDAKVSTRGTSTLTKQDVADAMNYSSNGPALTGSLQAEVQALANTGLGGAYTVTVQVNDTAGNHIQAATVRIGLNAASQANLTNAAGNFTTSLDAHTYSIAITGPGNNYSFTPTTFTVTGNATFTFQITQNVVSPPASPTDVLLYYYPVDQSGATGSGFISDWQLVNAPADIYPFNGTAASDGTGLWQVTVRNDVGTVRVTNQLTGQVVATVTVTPSSPSTIKIA